MTCARCGLPMDAREAHRSHPHRGGRAHHSKDECIAALAAELGRVSAIAGVMFEALDDAMHTLQCADEIFYEDAEAARAHQKASAAHSEGSRLQNWRKQV